MNKLIYLGSLVILFIWNTSYTLPTNHKKREALVVGKLKVEGKMIFINNKVMLYFNKNQLKRYAVNLNDSGYFSLKLPLGENEISALEYSNHGYLFRKNIAKEYATINLKETDKVYYIGDIKVKWNPTNADLKAGRGSNSGMVVGSPYGSPIYIPDYEWQEREKIPLYISDNDSSIAYFRNKLAKDNPEVIKELLKVKL